MLISISELYAEDGIIFNCNAGRLIITDKGCRIVIGISTKISLPPFGRIDTATMNETSTSSPYRIDLANA